MVVLLGVLITCHVSTKNKYLNNISQSGGHSLVGSMGWCGQCSVTNVQFGSLNLFGGEYSFMPFRQGS